MKIRAFALVPLFASSLALAAGPTALESVDATLSRYKKSFAQQVNAPTLKSEKISPDAQARRDEILKERQMAGDKFLKSKDKVRLKKIKLVRDGKKFDSLEQIKTGRARIELNDQATDLKDSSRLTADNKPNNWVTSLFAMDTANLTSGQVLAQPWSDDYWAIYRGILGARYADRNFKAASNEDWQKFYDYTQKTAPALKIFQEAAVVTTSDLASLSAAERADFRRLNMLSPSEKYDLLVGDTSFSLTRRGWLEGKQYADQDPQHKVETWMGICHGWAPAAYMQKRPLSPVTLRTKIGNKPITFFPADIKALASLMWANGSPNAKFIGGRCGDKSPKKDPTSGRVLDQDCFDTNPGTWHLVTVNKLGVEKRSFVLDVTYDYEVWNQPMAGYSYTYFNPATMDRAANVQQAKISYDAFAPNDKFRKIREARGWAGGRKPAYIVGVAMDAEYVVETEPLHLKEDKPELDALTTARWMYDLELDEQGNILGGEWYSNAHPDFLWTYDSTDTPYIQADASASGFWGKSYKTIPSQWTQPAIMAARQGQPLSKIVNSLIERSQGKLTNADMPPDDE